MIKIIVVLNNSQSENVKVRHPLRLYMRGGPNEQLFPATRLKYVNEIIPLLQLSALMM